ncbi:MAG: GNAT family N-acetyltransferase [Pseudomonadales bacterium]|jgi:GNAT superfamily N-acetyltransferase|nr:GNAT family N-acetyltransferase [Pseudomonadales bacterium]
MTADREAHLQLVEVSPFDLDELVAASRALYRDEGVVPPPALKLRVDLHERLQRGQARALLFRCGTDAPPLAFALLSRRGRRAHIEQFRVEPGLRRSGWGRRCVLALLDGPLADAEQVCVRVLEDNEPARAFWAALGFGAGRLALEVHPRP